MLFLILFFCFQSSTCTPLSLYLSDSISLTHSFSLCLALSLWLSLSLSLCLATLLGLLQGGSRCAGKVVLHHLGGATKAGTDWDINEATVVCRRLDCGSAVTATRGSYFGRGSGLVTQIYFSCRGSESELRRCLYSYAGFGSFSHDGDDAGVVCSGKTCWLDGVELFVFLLSHSCCTWCNSFLKWGGEVSFDSTFTDTFQVSGSSIVLILGKHICFVCLTISVIVWLHLNYQKNCTIALNHD